MVDGRHRVVDVRPETDAGRDRATSLLVVSASVARAHDDAGTDQDGDRIQRARQLGREGHEPWARERDHLDAGRVRLGQTRPLMRAAERRIDERPFDVSAQHPCAGGLGCGCGNRESGAAADRRRDQGGEKGGDAGGRQQL